MGRPVRVQRKRTKGWRMPPNTVSVARPSKWGNPFQVHSRVPVLDENLISVGWIEIKTVQDAVNAYRDWVKACMPEDFAELSGKNLACFCPLDQPCHADVLLELANQDTPSDA